MDLRDQKFGIEIEMTGITRQRAAEVLSEYLGGYSGTLELGHLVLNPTVKGDKLLGEIPSITEEAQKVKFKPPDMETIIAGLFSPEHD